MNVKAVDKTGTRIYAGDYITYAQRRGSGLWLNHGTVKKVTKEYSPYSYGFDKKPCVTVINQDGKEVRLFRIDNITVAMNMPS